MDESPTSHRSKRQKTDKSGRLSALQKLKQLKGSKNKYKVDELENVYDEVDEQAYGKTVLDRQCDDWIVDDGGGTGYVEDGREIFDDDLDDESLREAAKQDQKKGPRKRKREVENKKVGGSISSMFSNMANKKKAEEKIGDDDILGDLISELRNDTIKPIQKPRVNKFLSHNKVKEEKQSDNLIKGTIQKPKTILDDIDQEILYDTPNHKTNKPRIKQIEVVQNTVILKDNVTKISEKSDLDIDDSNFDEQFVADIPAMESNTDKVPQTNGVNVIGQSTEKAVKTEEMDQYIGDISDIDFGNVEMDSTITQKTSSTSSASQALNNSQMWKEKEAELHNNDIFAKAWEDDFSIVSQEQVSQIEENVQMLPFPTILNENNEKIFRFFWWDAFEDPYKQPGVVHLFGKVFIDSSNEYVSCCIAIKNIPRKIYLLPREFIKNKSGEKEENFIQNVYDEFNSYTRRLNIDEFRCTEVNMKYAFEREGIPKSADYLEVKYSASQPAIDADYSGPSIEAVFGTTTNALELLLIERKIQGPCWLDIKALLPVETPFSWCKVQGQCLKMENITVSKDQTILSTVPPVVLATINIQVSLDPKQQKNEIMNIGILLHNKFQLDKAPPKPPFNQHYCLVTHPRSVNWPMKARDRLAKITQTQVIRCETELDLLEKFLEILQVSDPDIVVGYDCGFQFDVLMNKIFSLKVKNWSRVSKLKRTTPPYFKGKLNLGQIFCGRPICDITTSAKELNLKVRSYDLVSLCVAVLNKKEYECKEIKPEDCLKFYDSVDKLENLIQSTMVEASYILGIVLELNILPLALKITNIAGNTLSRTLSAGRAERNEFLLMHAFHEKGYITPDKRQVSKKKDADTTIQSGKKKPAYAGGLVLEPKKGFYDKLILLMDFNSLYPSIIQEFNLCFTTVEGAAYKDVNDLSLPDANVEEGIVPTEIRRLVQSRVAVKQLMKAPKCTPELKEQYNIRQLALKLTANSMYGCLGATHCRFYAKGLAALVTMKGREILQNTKSLVEKANYEVIYGDTDSIMINTNILEFEEVANIGKEIKKEVNKTYKKIELDIDGVFRYLLLLQKKKYASVTMTKLPNGQVQYSKELKGLDIVRRDWCKLACDIGNQILDQLLNDQPIESRLENIFSILQTVGNNLREGKLPLSSLVITKQLSKNPQDYPNDKKLSHVIVALRLNESGGRMWKTGDTVPYIICEDGSDKTALERAYHIEEFKKSEVLKVDVNYYLLNQIHPVVLRICEPINGIDDVLLAQHLGVGELYKPKKTFTSNEGGEVPLCIQDNRYDNCHPFRFTCRNPNCKAENEIKTTFTEFAGVLKPSLAMCSNPECNSQPWKYIYAIQNKLQLDIRRFITEYYYGDVECENPICSKVMRRVTQDTFGTFPKCYNCLDGNVHRVFKETELYNQLSYYLHLFTLNQSNNKNSNMTPSRDLTAAYDTIKEFVEKQIQNNAYSVVDLTKLFWPNVQESNIDALNEIEQTVTTIDVEDILQEANEEEEEDQQE